ncbi:efflux RND transporter periplasmic adaptor subunit [Terasakiispira papahanaumokuakeensis]|nr:efflux RND transporter periplasmic adaptor subunit [Terasakiispira papahanaumokuakeensis]
MKAYVSTTRLFKNDGFKAHVLTTHVLKTRPLKAVTLMMGLITAALLTGCQSDEKNQAASSQQPPEVDVVTLQAEPVTLKETFTGRLESPQTVALRPRVTGYIDQVVFKEGETVAAGDLLFQIDPRPYQAKLQAAQAALDQAKSQLQLAEAEASRGQRLLNSHAIAQELNDQRQATLLNAQASVEGAQAALDSARLDLTYTRITAPISGRIGRALVTQGNLASANQTLLTTLVSVDPLYVYFNSNESSIQGIHQQQTLTTSVAIGVTGETGFPHQGRLDFIDNQLNANTGTLRYRAVLPNPQEQLKPGQFARVNVPVAQHQAALVLDRKAVIADQARRFVYVINDEQKAIPHPVTLGQTVGNRVMITSGLQAGDRVVVNGIQKIFFAGMPVTPHSVEGHSLIPDALTPDSPVSDSATSEVAATAP